MINNPNIDYYYINNLGETFLKGEIGKCYLYDFVKSSFEEYTIMVDREDFPLRLQNVIKESILITQVVKNKASGMIVIAELLKLHNEQYGDKY
jgi:hypothetical protein